MVLSDSTLSGLITIRREIHSNPERSGSEKKTAGRIASELGRIGVNSVQAKIGETGILACVHAAKKTRKTILFRAELDAIAVGEQSGVAHRSQKEGVMHGCGHDGHMAILLGVAQYAVNNRPQNTDVYFLFQPAEETGEGMQRVLKDPQLKELTFDHAFALHNLPGAEQNRVLIKPGPFASASVGLDLAFRGRSSHAGYPEEGINPAPAIGSFLQKLNPVKTAFMEKSGANKITVTYIEMGERAFGISPGDANAGVTIRASLDEELERGVQAVLDLIEEIKGEFEGELTVKRAEPFAATVNSEEGAEVVRKAAEKAGLKVTELESPFRWSEDFGEFRNKCPITLFGLGAGKQHPPLHSEYYDFNDELIPAGVALFAGILKIYDTGGR